MTARRRKTIRWLLAAKVDLREIVESLSSHAPRTAEAFGDKILAQVEKLADFPYLGAVCPHYRRVRQLIFGKYVIYYSAHRREVVIRAVVRGARFFRSSWFRRE